MQPNNVQALNLKEKIEQKLTNGSLKQFYPILLFLEGVIGLAVVGGLAAAAVGALMVMYRSRRK